MAPRGRPKGSTNANSAKLSPLAAKKLEYLQLVLGKQRVDILEGLIDVAFSTEDSKRSGKLSAAVNAEIEAKKKADALKAELTAAADAK